MAAKNHTESYIVVDSLFNVPRNICGGSVLVGKIKGASVSCER